MNAEAPPAFGNAGQEFPKIEADELREFWAEATERIKQDTDPAAQKYIMRLDKKTLVKSEAEMASCQKKNVPLRYGIGYRHALHLLKEEDAKAAAKKKRRLANKRAKVARRRNR